MIGNFLVSAGHNPVESSPTFQVRESEISFQAVVDPYARADFFLSFSNEGVEIEEAFVTFLSAALADAGQGRQVQDAVRQDQHDASPPAAVGGRAAADRQHPAVAGHLGGRRHLRVEGDSRFPGDTFSELYFQVIDGTSGEGLFVAPQKSDLTYNGQYRAYRDFGDDHNLEMGVSYAYGHNGTSATNTTQLENVHLVYRWKPLQGQPYRSFILRSEYFWSQREQPDGKQDAQGFFVAGDYQLGRRWFTGARYEFADRATDATLRDNGVAATLTFMPSEFSLLRAEYRYREYAPGDHGQRGLPPAPVRHRRPRRPSILRSRMKRIAHRPRFAPALTASPALAAVQIVTTLQDFASIAGAVGGDRVETFALAKGYQDPHFVDAKPSFVLQLSRADLLIVAGLELEIGYLPPLIDQSRNEKIHPGRARLPRRLDRLRHPRAARPASVTRAMGDVHPFGNPHYWTDPENGRVIARSIAARLAKLDPAGAAEYDGEPRRLRGEADRGTEGWEAALGAVRRHQGRHLPQLLAELRQALQARRGRPRRAQARHPAVAGAHPRDHQPDPGEEDPGHPHRAVLRPQDPDSDRREDRRALVIFIPSVGGMPEIDGLLRPLRLRRQAPGRRARGKKGGPR